MFEPERALGMVVLSNTGPSTAISADMIGSHVWSRLEGRPAAAIAEMTIPARGGVLSLVRVFGAYWLTMFAAGGFAFCVVLCVQGTALLLLSRRAYLRVSSWLQMGLFLAIVGGFLAQPVVVHGGTLLEAGWWPSYAFLGLMQWLTGSPAMGEWAGSAAVGFVGIGVLTAAVWTGA